MIKSQFFLRFSKAIFDRPSSKGHVQDLAQRPAFPTGHAVGKKTFHFVGQHVASRDECASSTYRTLVVSLSPASVPASFPDFRATLRVLKDFGLIHPHARIAGNFECKRLVSCIEAVVRFYRDGLGLTMLGSFEDPDGYRIVLQNGA